MDVQQKPRRGRPPKAAADGPRGGKGAAMTTRVTRELRAALDAEAARWGWTVGQVAEMWLQRGRLFGDFGAAGPAIAETTLSLLISANEVIRQHGHPTTSVKARDELRLRWREIASKMLPETRDSSPDRAAAEALVSAVRYAAIDAFSVARGLDPADETLARLEGILVDIANGSLHAESPNWPNAQKALSQAAKDTGGEQAQCIEIVLTTMDAAARSVARANAKAAAR